MKYISVSEFAKLMSILRDDSIPAANDYVAADTEGNLYSMYELPEELQKYYNLRKQMNYRYFHDND